MSTQILNLFGGLFSNKSAAKKNVKSRKRNSQSRPNTYRSLGLEGLERRELMSATTSAGLAPVAPVATSQVISPAVACPPQAAGDPALNYGLAGKATSSSEINLTWNGVQQTTYICEYFPATTGSSGGFKEIGVVTNGTSHFTVDGLSPGVKYEFELGSNGVFTQNGTLDYTAPYDVTTPTVAKPVTPTLQPPSAPTITGVSSGSPSTVTLSWTPSPTATSYLVQEYKPATAQWVNVGTVTSTAGTVQNLPGGTATLFRVAGINAAGTGAFSADVSGLTRPASPTIDGISTVSSSQIDLYWTAVGGTNGYEIFDKTPTGSYELYRTVAAGTLSLPITGLAAGTTYSFEVVAYNGAGGSVSNPVSDTTAVGVPGTPANFAVKALTTTEAQLSFSPVAGATSYEIYIYTSTGFQPIASATSTVVDINGLPAGGTYAFFVVAKNSAGYGIGTAYKTVTL